MSLKVRDVMVRDVKTINAEAPVSSAAEIMNQFEIGCVIVAQKRKPLGIVTERDILRRLVFAKRDPARTKTKEVMSKPLITVRPHQTLRRAVKMMIERNIKKLIVTRRNELVGVLSFTDLVPFLEKQSFIDDEALENASRHMKKVFEIYYDPIRQIRKKCPFTLGGGGMAISCIGSKCMWYVKERCVFLNLMVRTT